MTYVDGADKRWYTDWHCDQPDPRTQRIDIGRPTENRSSYSHQIMWEWRGVEDGVFGNMYMHEAEDFNDDILPRSTP